MNETERFQWLKQRAWDDRDLDLYTFYGSIEHELERLRSFGHVVALFYERGGITDEGWNTLFESLFDAGLLSEPEEVEDASASE